jgi:hypothetical protein
VVAHVAGVARVAGVSDVTRVAEVTVVATSWTGAGTVLESFFQGGERRLLLLHLLTSHEVMYAGYGGGGEAREAGVTGQGEEARGRGGGEAS